MKYLLKTFIICMVFLYGVQAISETLKCKQTSCKFYGGHPSATYGKKETTCSYLPREMSFNYNNIKKQNYKWNDKKNYVNCDIEMLCRDSNSRSTYKLKNNVLDITTHGFISETHGDFTMRSQFKCEINNKRKNLVIVNKNTNRELKSNLKKCGSYKHDCYETIEYPGMKSFSRGYYKDNLRHGKWVGYYDNGQLQFEGYYKKSLKEGNWITYYRNGQIRNKGNYINGKLEGNWVGFNVNGSIWEKFTGNFKNGIRIYIKTNPDVSLAELNKEKSKRLKEELKRRELERRLAELKNKQKQEQARIDIDTQKPIINAFSELNGSNAIISGRVTDNTEVAEVLLDGEQLSLKKNGTFETELYVPRNGLNIEIVAFDRKGNRAIETLRLERDEILQSSGPSFDRLNPSDKRVKSNPNALALIIGVADYSKTSANALYADKDAQQFYDYATMKLGIPSSNIKELVNDKADLGEILINVKEWLRRSAKPNKSDIYIYFAGHGLASQDGSKMYLLPYDGRPRLLENTALLRDDLFKDIKQANPRSVIVFLDTCYSGVTRNEETLIAGRPIVIKEKEQAIPDGFTLFSAASNEQISRPLEEAKHGMFSYFLMKGMEGDADTNADNKITARELHAYVEQNVVQQSSGSQTPELQGDKDRVLVQFK